MNAYPKYFESELGKPVLLKLGTSLQPIHQAIFLMWAHETDSAKLLLKKYFKSGDFDINVGAAISLYASIASPKDSSDFISFLNDPRIQDRSSVVLGMLRSCPSSLNMLLRSNKLLNSKDIHRTILFNLGLVDSSMAGRMIRNIIATKTYTDDNGDIYAGAMSAGVVLKPAEIYQLINENFDSSTENAAMYSNFTGQQNVLANYIVGRLTMALSQVTTRRHMSKRLEYSTSAGGY